MESVRFGTEIFHRAASPRHQQLYRQLLELTCCYCQKAPFYELDCAGNINALFRALLDVSAFTVVSEAERPAQRARQERVRYSGGADRGGLFPKSCCWEIWPKNWAWSSTISPTFSGEHFGLSFQEYLAKLRCEKARRGAAPQPTVPAGHQPLLAAFPVPSIFSGLFKSSTEPRPGSTAVRPRGETGELPAASVLTSQKFLSDQESLRVVQRLLEQG